jgi:hypothetical protein
MAAEQLSQHLQRNVLEGKRGAVEQFQQILAVTNLHQGRDLGRVEIGIGGFDACAQFRIAERPGGEARQDLESHVLVASALESGDLAGAELRPALRQIEAAIRRQARQQHVGKRGWRRLPPGGNELHCHPLILGVIGPPPRPNHPDNGLFQADPAFGNMIGQPDT